MEITTLFSAYVAVKERIKRYETIRDIRFYNRIAFEKVDDLRWLRLDRLERKLDQRVTAALEKIDSEGE